jgi:two-component system chemotaxis sensor kinase CheA
MDGNEPDDAIKEEKPPENTEKKGEESGKKVSPEEKDEKTEKSAAPTDAKPGADGKNILLDWQKDNTIRIQTRKLDTLLNRSSELMTTLSKQDEINSSVNGILGIFQKWFAEWEKHKALWDKIEDNLDEFGEMPSPSLFSDDYIKKIFSISLENMHYLQNVSDLLKNLGNTFYEDAMRTRFIVENLEREVKDIRMLPISHLFKLLPRMVRDLAKIQKKEIDINLEGLETQVDKLIIEELKDPLVHILRNAVDHGIELPEDRKKAGKSPNGKIWLKAFYDGSNIVIEVGDDGKGIDSEEIIASAIRKKIVSAKEAGKLTESEKINFVFRPGFSTQKIITDISGRGVGLDVVRENVEKLKGQIHLITEKGGGTRFILRLPLTIGTTQVLIVSVQSLIYAIPIHSIVRMQRIEEKSLQRVAGKQIVENEGEAVVVADLKNVLGNPAPVIEKDGKTGRKSKDEVLHEEKKTPVIFLESMNRKAGIIVDHLLDEQNVVVKSFGSRLLKVPNVMGMAILSNGELATVLNPADLIESIHSSSFRGVARSKRKKGKQVKKKILIVDDSITTRTLEKNILESAGYDVALAINGAEAWDIIQSKEFDLVVSDVEMPEMNGFDLIRTIRSSPDYVEMPTILVTSLQSPEDRKRGEEVGANAYITKGTFDQKKLLETIQDLING